MNGDEIFALVVFGLLALAGCFGIFIKHWLSRDEYSEEWDDFDEYLDYLPIVKEILKDAKPCEVFEPDPEIARLRKETQRMALTFKKRLLRRLLKKGPDPDPKADKSGDDDQVLDE